MPELWEVLESNEAEIESLQKERDRFKIALNGTIPWLEHLLANHANLAGLSQDIENIKTLVGKP